MGLRSSNLFDIFCVGKTDFEDKDMQLDYEFLWKIFYIFLAYECIVYKQNILDAALWFFTEDFGFDSRMASSYSYLCSKDIYAFYS